MPNTRNKSNRKAPATAHRTPSKKSDFNNRYAVFEETESLDEDAMAPLPFQTEYQDDDDDQPTSVQVDAKQPAEPSVTAMFETISIELKTQNKAISRLFDSAEDQKDRLETLDAQVIAMNTSTCNSVNKSITDMHSKFKCKKKEHPILFLLMVTPSMYLGVGARILLNTLTRVTVCGESFQGWIKLGRVRMLLLYGIEFMSWVDDDINSDNHNQRQEEQRQQEEVEKSHDNSSSSF
jgi:hypothetical protein